MRSGLWLGAAGLALVVTAAAGVVAQRAAVRRPNDDLRSLGLRSMPGLLPDENLLFNGWGITPAGEHIPLQGDLPLRMLIAPDGRTLAVVTGGFNNTGLSLVDVLGRRVTQFLPLPRAFNGLAFNKEGNRVFVSGGNSGQIFPFKFAEGQATVEEPVSPAPEADQPFLAGMAVHAPTGKLYVCNQANQEVWVVDPATLKLERAIGVGMHPHSCVFGADQRHLYVSNWGSRTVSVVDTQTNRRVRDIAVGVRPNDMAVGKDGRLFVACAGDNTVHVIQTRALEAVEAPADPTRRIPEGVREIIATSLYPASPEGSTPDGVAVSGDGKTLYVVNADNNDLMAVDLSEPETSRVIGFIPTGWYPSAVAVSADGNTVFCGNGKGLRYRPNYPTRTPDPRRLHKAPPFDYVGRMLQGSVSVITKPDQPTLVTYTEQVRRNSPYSPESLYRVPTPQTSCIPDRVGEECPIKYVLYIIKENRTYDQVFGDYRDAKGRRAGNGDPNLVHYGEDVAPNHHQLAREYVLLDNLYCNGEVSVDGHSWCDAAIATDFTQRSWLMSYSQHGRIPGNPELETPVNGYLWDLCKRHGIPFKCYGEGANRVPAENRGTWPGGRDKDRVSGFIQDLKQAETSGDLPRFMIMALGEDHTRGTTPGANTPDACVASNDIGLGRIVEACSLSRFWKEMAIFVIEDDAQNGPDHIDAHRTVGFVISPWVKQGSVDSTLYTTASMIRTMELILGVPPLTQYDAGATPMFNSFGKKAEAKRYVQRAPKVDINAINGQNAPGARLSAAMNWEEYDEGIDEDQLNRILWRAAKGPNVPYPAPIHRAVFPRPLAKK